MLAYRHLSPYFTFLKVFLYTSELSVTLCCFFVMISCKMIKLFTHHLLVFPYGRDSVTVQSFCCLVMCSWVIPKKTELCTSHPWFLIFALKFPGASSACVLPRMMLQL